MEGLSDPILTADCTDSGSGHPNLFSQEETKEKEIGLRTSSVSSVTSCKTAVGLGSHPRNPCNPRLKTDRGSSGERKKTPPENPAALE
jgi:hypothetical protein